MEGRDPCPLPSSAEATPAGLCWALGSLVCKTWTHCTEGNNGPQGWWKDKKPSLPTGKGWGSCDDPSAWRRGSLGHLTHLYKHLQGECQEDRARLFPVVPSNRDRSPADANRHQVTHRRFPPKIRKHREADQALAEAAHRDGGVPILEGIQKSSGHGLGQVALGGPTWAGCWTRWSPEVPSSLNFTVTLWKTSFQLHHLQSRGQSCLADWLH